MSAAHLEPQGRAPGDPARADSRGRPQVRGPASRFAGRAGGWCGAAAAACLALGAWLAVPRDPTAAGPAALVVVYDRSASVERTRPEYGAWLQADLAARSAEARRQGAVFGALVFAGDRAWWVRPGAAGPPGEAPRTGDGNRSELSAALELALDGARRAGAVRGRVVWHSDGRATGAAAVDSLRTLAAAGFRAERAALPAAALDDLELLSLGAPEQLEAGAPLACELSVELHPGARLAGPRNVRIEVRLRDGLADPSGGAPGNREAGALVWERTLAAGETRARWRVELGPAPAGGAGIEARVLLEGDPIPENDGATRWVPCSGALPIAVVAEDPALAAAFRADSERWPGLALFPIGAAELALRTGDFAAVLSLDVEPERFSRPSMEAFLGAGGGWLHCAGSSALRATGTAAAGDAWALLPLMPEAPPRDPRDVLLLVDGSGSMAETGFAAVREALPRIAPAVPRGDRLWLSFFARELEPAVLVREAITAQPAPGAEPTSQGVSLDVAALLSRREPGGATRIVDALQALARSRGADAPAMLALLATDGREAAQHSAGTFEALRASLAAARIELAVFAFGLDPDREFLARLLPPGRAPVDAAGAGPLAVLLERAVEDERTRVDTSAVESDGEAFPAGSLARELCTALSPPARVERAWLARASAEGAVLWRTAQGDPLLALRPWGAGFAAAFASLPTVGWCSAAGEPGSLGPLLRGLARARPRLPRAEISGRTLLVRGLPASTPALVLARLPDGRTLSLGPPEALGESALTTRSGTLPPGRTSGPAGTPPALGVLEIRSLPGEGSPEGLLLAALGMPGGRSEEFTAPREALPEAAGMAMGGDLGGPGGAPSAQGAAPGGSGHPAVPWLLSSGLLLLSLGLWLGLGTRAAPPRSGNQGLGRELR